MAEDGGGPPEFMRIITGDQMYDYGEKHAKREEEEEEEGIDSKLLVENFTEFDRGISIAEFTTVSAGGELPVASGHPCFTIPSGINPCELLDSPVMLPNSQAPQSPTTGTFHFSAPNHDQSSKLILKSACNYEMDQSFPMNDNAQEFLPNHLLVENKPSFEGLHEYPKDLQEITKQGGCSLEAILAESNTPAFDNKNKFQEGKCSSIQPPRNTRNQTAYHTDQSGAKERSTHDPNQDKYHHPKGPCFPKEVPRYSEDGFYWRKYGQKHVKGSEYPRSYYKCTNTSCPVRKKVERSHDGQITEIVYKGSHNHPKPQNFKRFGETSSDQMSGGGSGLSFKTEGAITGGCSDWRPDSTDGMSLTSFLTDFSNPVSRSTSAYESMETHELSSAYGNQDGGAQNEASPESQSFNDEDGESNGDYEPKKRKREIFSNETAIPRSTREPRVVFQIESDIDILDDGYRWRKYGQKVVKGNPNPRSYYKCTTPGCPVRKHVERAANDIKSVITAYEGKHNHEVPSSKTATISDNLSPAAGGTNSSLSPAQKPNHHHLPKAGIEQLVQDHNLPSLYLERKPILNCNINELMMRSNLATDLNFGTTSSAHHPLSFPSFHSLPYGSSLLMNGSSRMKTSPSSGVYPMFPQYMPLPSSQINQVPAAGSAACNINLRPLTAGTFNFGNYNTLQPSTTSREQQEIIRECNARMLKPKEEHREDGELYGTCLSVADHENGTASIN